MMGAGRARRRGDLCQTLMVRRRRLCAALNENVGRENASTCSYALAGFSWTTP